MRGRLILSATIVTAWMVACASESTTPPGNAPGGASTAAQSSGAPAPAPSIAATSSNVTTLTVDASGATPTGPAACDELGDLSGSGITAAFDSGSQWFWGPIAGRPTPTRVGVIASASAATTQGQTIQLGVGAEANYETCTHCIAIAVGCVGEDCTNATWFFAKSGTARFDSVASAPGGAFSSRFDNVVLTQVTVDPTTFHSTEVPAGGCFHINSATFSATTASSSPPPPPPPPPDSDGGTTQSDSGTDATTTPPTQDAGTSSNGNNGNHGGRGGNTGALKTNPDGGSNVLLLDSGTNQ
jgi:hypothetical protein